LKAFELLK